MKKTNDFISGWNAIGRTMAFYRFILIFVIALAIVTGLATVYALQDDPLVVVEKCENKHFYRTQRTAININPNDVKEYAQKFISALYGGEDISCMVSRGLDQKLKKLSGYKGQYVGRLEVKLQKKHALVDFDLIMNVNNVPIALKKSVELQIQKKKEKMCNPIGLYVNGISEKG